MITRVYKPSISHGMVRYFSTSESEQSSKIETVGFKKNVVHDFRYAEHYLVRLHMRLKLHCPL